MDQTEARFSEFFRELAVAGRALAAYPPGHPAAAAGLAKAAAALASLSAATGPIELAATRDAILWGDRRFTSPTAVHLAKLLRRRRAAGIFLDGEVGGDELEVFLRALALDARRAREAGSLTAELAAAGLVRLRARDLDFSSVALVEDDEEVSAAEAGSFPVRLIRRLLADGNTPSEKLADWFSSGKSAADLLQFLLDGGGETGDAGPWIPAALAGVVRAAAADYCESPDAQRAAAIAWLHPRLRKEDGGRLTEELAAAIVRQASARESLAQLCAALSPQAAADLRHAIAEGAAREPEDPDAAPSAAQKMKPRHVAHLRQAFATEDVDTIRDARVPADEVATLLELPKDPVDVILSPAAEEIRRDLADPGLERDTSGALLELAQRAEVPPDVVPSLLRRVEAGYLRFLSKGGMREAVALVEGIRQKATGEGPVSEAFRRSVESLSGREPIEALVASLAKLPEESAGLVPALLHNLEPAAIRHLLNALAQAEDRRLRFLLLDSLAKLGSVVARDAATLLGDPRWYVVRNMLLILRRVGDSKSVPAVRKCAEHPDLRVRLEAIHNLFAFDRERSRELLRQALNHSDLREAEAAMVLAGKYGIAQAVEPIAAYLCKWDPFGKRRAVRIQAIRALAAIGDPLALAGLGRFRARYQLLPPANEERRELYRTLTSYPPDSRRIWIESGLRSRDAEIRRICAAIASQSGNTP